MRSPEDLVKHIYEAFETLIETGGGGRSAAVSASGSERTVAANVEQQEHVTGSDAVIQARSASSSGSSSSNNSSKKTLKAEARAIEDLSRHLHQLKLILYGDSDGHKPANEEISGVR